MDNVEKAFNNFLENATEENYQKFINTANTLSGSNTEENFFLGVAALAKAYEDNKDLFQKYFGIETLDDLGEMDSDQLLHNILYAENADYNSDLKSLLSKVEGNLQDAYNYFNQAESGVGDKEIGIVIGDGKVSFDKYDFQCLKALTKFMEAMCYLGEALNLGDENINWNVTVDENSKDLRELIENGEDIPEDVWKEFLNNNSNLLKWSDTGKLSDFRQAVKDLKDLVIELKDDFSKMDNSTLIAREGHAFDINDPAGVANLEGMANFLDSFVNAFSDRYASLVVYDTDWTNYQAVQFGGKWFKVDVLDFYKVTLSPSQDQQITIYDLVNGNKSLRDLFNYDGPFYNNTEKELWKQNVCELKEELETYEIPEANISIDGNADDWANVPEFINNSGVILKLARSGNSLYIYLESSDFVGNISINAYYDSEDDHYWAQAYIYRNFWGDSEEFSAGYSGSSYCSNDFYCNWQNANYEKIQDSSGKVIVEVEFSDFLSELTKPSVFNDIYIDNWHGESFRKQVKLLPISDD